MTSGPSIRTVTLSPVVGPTGSLDSQPISAIINMGTSPGTTLEPRIIASILPARREHIPAVRAVRLGVATAPELTAAGGRDVGEAAASSGMAHDERNAGQLAKPADLAARTASRFHSGRFWFPRWSTVFTLLH
jgi:hypothetical protein